MKKITLLFVGICLTWAHALDSLNVSQSPASNLGQSRDQFSLAAPIQIRHSMIVALQKGDLQQYKALLDSSLQEFRNLQILNAEEGVMSALVLGEYDKLRDTLPLALLRLRFKSTQEFNTYSHRAIDIKQAPRNRLKYSFCPEDYASPLPINDESNLSMANYLAEIGDLDAALVNRFLKNGGIARLKVQAPDLAELVALSKCPSSHSWMDQDPESQDQKIRNWLLKFPNHSTLYAVLEQDLPKVYVPSGLGFVIAGGPLAQIWGNHANQLISNGLGGGFAVDMWFEKFTISVNPQYRTFTAIKDFAIEDTLGHRGKTYDQMSVDFEVGHNFVLGSHWIVRPYLGLGVNEIDMDVDSAYNSQGTVSILAPSYSLGGSLDWIANNPNQEVFPIYGLRLWATYHWSGMQAFSPDLGSNYLSLGLYFTLGILGARSIHEN